MRAITDLLDAEHVPYHRLNSGTMVLASPNGGKRVIRMAAAGTADLIALPEVPCHGGHHHPAVVYIEAKRPKGGRLTRAQHDFRLLVEGRGHAYLLANSVDVVRDWLEAAMTGKVLHRISTGYPQDIHRISTGQVVEK